jgi:hypothetical protein
MRKQQPVRPSELIRVAFVNHQADAGFTCSVSQPDSGVSASLLFHVAAGVPVPALPIAEHARRRLRGLTIRGRRAANRRIAPVGAVGQAELATLDVLFAQGDTA